MSLTLKARNKKNGIEDHLSRPKPKSFDGYKRLEAQKYQKHIFKGKFKCILHRKARMNPEKKKYLSLGKNFIKVPDM